MLICAATVHDFATWRVWRSLLRFSGPPTTRKMSISGRIYTETSSMLFVSATCSSERRGYVVSVFLASSLLSAQTRVYSLQCSHSTTCPSLRLTLSATVASLPSGPPHFATSARYGLAIIMTPSGSVCRSTESQSRPRHYFGYYQRSPTYNPSSFNSSRLPAWPPALLMAKYSL